MWVDLSDHKLCEQLKDLVTLQSTADPLEQSFNGARVF